MAYGFDIITLIIVLFVILWFYGRKNYDYWNKRNVFSVKPLLPFFGNIKISYLLKSNLELISGLYKSLSGKSYGGIYFFTQPAVIVLDPELIKKILVTDFNNFVSRGFHTNDCKDPLSKNLIHVNGINWKHVRPKLQTAFNYSKLKNMMADMDRLAKYIVEQIECGNVKRVVNNDRPTFEAINISERYMIDVICSTVFGVKSNAIDFDGESKFYQVAKEIFDGYHFLIHAFVGFLFPHVHKFFNLSVARIDVTNFFTAVSKEAVAMRENMCGKFSNVERKNFLDTLISMVKGQKTVEKGFPDGNPVEAIEDNCKETDIVYDQDFVAANVFMFFAAGYDSSAKICTFCLFELAANESIQKRARQEILKILEEYNDVLSLEAVQKMTYLEQIVSETNRKYPILSVIFRKCDKLYTMPDGGIIEPGIPIIIPSSAIHFDPQYYPDPEKFNPDRFSQENKRNIHPSTHLPFGMGPRICVAWQFAIVEIKVILARILSQYTISLHHTSDEYPLRLKPKAFLLTPYSDIYVNCTRNN